MLLPFTANEGKGVLETERGNVSSKEKEEEGNSVESEARLCKFCHTVHIAFNFISYIWSGILMKSEQHQSLGIYP